MNKKLTLLFCLLAIVLPIMGFSQTDGDYSNLLQFLKGDGAFEKGCIFFRNNFVLVNDAEWSFITFFYKVSFVAG